MDIDPESSDFGKILMEIPLPSDLVAHHIFFNRDRTKAYITALGKSILHVVDLTTVSLSAARHCRAGLPESARISSSRKITGPGTSPVWARARSLWVMRSKIRRSKRSGAADPAAAFILYPHGIAIHNGIDRVLVTSTVKPDICGGG